MTEEFELDDWREQEIDTQMREMQAYARKKAVKQDQAMQVENWKSAAEEAASQFGLEPDEFRKAFAQPATSPEHAKERAALQKKKMKEYLAEAFQLEQEVVKEKSSGGAGRMQDAHGRFTSPKKIASEKAISTKIQDLKARLHRGERISEDELLEVMPRLR